MITRYANNDPYTYPDSAILINLKGIRDEKELDSYEGLCGIKRILEGLPAGNFDYSHLKAIHHHIFQDVCKWAGQERNVPISKGSSQFATPAFINNLATDLLNKLVREEALTGLDLESFIERATYYILELNVIHPFREGNGRTLRQYLFLLAENAGFDLDAHALEDGWMDACIQGFHGDESVMAELLRGALTEFED